MTRTSECVDASWVCKGGRTKPSKVSYFRLYDFCEAQGRWCNLCSASYRISSSSFCIANSCWRCPTKDKQQSPPSSLHRIHILSHHIVFLYFQCQQHVFLGFARECRCFHVLKRIQAQVAAEMIIVFQSHNVARRGLNTYNQRKLGSNTSVLRTNRIVRLDIDEGRCETWHHIVRLDIAERRCETWHHITIHH